MLKGIFLSAIISLTSTLSFAEPVNIDNWIGFGKEYSFAAEILTRDGGLNYWVLPLAEDEEGTKQAREMIRKMESVTHRENPFVISIILAGVRYDYNDKQATDKDTFSIQVENDLQTLGLRQLAFVRCMGRYLEINTPYCVIDFENGLTLQRDLLSRGYVTLSENPKEVSPDNYAVFKEAEASAKRQEIGVWVPFYFMLKGIGG